MHWGFFIRILCWLHIWRSIERWFRRFTLHLFVSTRYSILIWYLKREYPNTQLSDIKAVSVLKWVSWNWCEKLAAFSDSACPTSNTEQSSVPLINGPLVDRQFPPLLQGVELSWGVEELGVRGDSLLWVWPGRTAGRQPAVSQRTKASSQLSKQGSQLYPSKKNISFFWLKHWYTVTRDQKHRNRKNISWKYREPCLWAGCAGVGRAGGLGAVLSLQLYRDFTVDTQSRLAWPCHSLSLIWQHKHWLELHNRLASRYLTSNNAWMCPLRVTTASWSFCIDLAQGSSFIIHDLCYN